MNKKDISNKLQYVFEGLEISKKKKLYLTEVFTSIIETAVEGIETPEIKQATSDKIGGVKIGYVQNDKNYPVVLDTYGKAYVVVPWTDNNTTYDKATDAKLGLVKIGFTESDKNYAVKLDENGKAYVAVPWTDTKYSAATESNLGLVKQAATISPVDGAAELSAVISAVNTLISNLQAAGIIKQQTV